LQAKEIGIKRFKGVLKVFANHGAQPIDVPRNKLHVPN
jgi:hypothetical protein